VVDGGSFDNVMEAVDVVGGGGGDFGGDVSSSLLRLGGHQLYLPSHSTTVHKIPGNGSE
jgi:hypothetical protein